MPFCAVSGKSSFCAFLCPIGPFCAAGAALPLLHSPITPARALCISSPSAPLPPFCVLSLRVRLSVPSAAFLQTCLPPAPSGSFCPYSPPRLFFPPSSPATGKVHPEEKMRLSASFSQNPLDKRITSMIRLCRKGIFKGYIDIDKQSLLYTKRPAVMHDCWSFCVFCRVRYFCSSALVSITFMYLSARAGADGLSPSGVLGVTTTSV